MSSAKVIFFHLIVILSNSEAQKTMKVLRSTLKLSEEATAITGAHMQDNRRVNITDITMCIRFKFKLLGGYEGRSRIITIEDWRNSTLDPDFSLLAFGAEYPNAYFTFGYPKRRGSYKSFLISDPETNNFKIWDSNRWSHVCIAYQRSDGFIKMIKDGKTLSVNYSDPAVRSVQIPDDFLRKVYLGRCSYDFIKTCSAPEAEFSDFNLWDEFLSTKELQDWTSCKSLTKGNIVNWDEAQFQLEYMKTETLPFETVCSPVRPGHVLFPEQKNMSMHMQMCQKLKGHLSVVKDENTQSSLIEQIKQEKQCKNKFAADTRFWAGWSDEEVEGDFRDLNENVSLNTSSFQPWYFGEPNGDSLENCAVVWINRNAWNDESCSTKACAFCELETAPKLKLRGLCFGSPFDTHYSWTREMINGRHSFRGYSDTFLFYNSTNQVWILQLYSDPEVFATTKTTDYPFGSLMWHFTNMPCYEGKIDEGILNFNACDDDDFNCADGSCVPIEERCNGKNNCPDRTDEVNCDIFTIQDSYLKSVPPEPTNGFLLARVGVSIDVLSILDVSEVNSYVQLQLNVKLAWRDNRLTMFNLKEEENLNTLTPKLRQKIWIPHIVFINTESMEESLNDEKAFAIISREGPYKTSLMSSVHNAHVFEGAENLIINSRVYSFKFTCEFDVAVYPFDTQLCSAIIRMKGNQGNFAQLFVDNFQYLGPIDLTQYFVKDSRMRTVHLQKSNETAIQVELIFSRRLLSTMLTTYLPTFLICLVSFSTNYFKPFFFEAIVTVNLTSLLVLTTLFISVSNSLPPTAYVKMIEIWLIFNLFVPFSEVILQTMLEKLREEEKADYNHHGYSMQAKQGQKFPVDYPINKVTATVNGKVIKVAPGLEGNMKQAIAKEMQTKQRTRRLHSLVKFMANKGLPITFGLFAFFYFVAGALIYNGQLYYDFDH